MGKDAKTCHFQECWIRDEQFKELMRNHQSDNKKAICMYCHKREIKLDNMGVAALTSHMKSKGRKEVENTNVRMRFFFNRSQPPSEEQPSTSTVVIDDDDANPSKGTKSSTAPSAQSSTAASGHASPASSEALLSIIKHYYFY